MSHDPPLPGVSPLQIPKTLAVIDARSSGNEGLLEQLGDTIVSAATSGLGSRLTTALPANITGPLVLADTSVGMKASTQLLEVSSVAGGIADGYAVYPGAHASGADVIAHPTQDGVEDFLVFETAPATRVVKYQIDLGDKVAGLRVIDNVLELLDAAGEPRIHMTPPELVSIDGARTPATVTVEDCAVDTDPRPPWGRPTTAPGATSCTVDVSWGSAIAYPAMLDPYWSSGGNMITSRSSFVSVYSPTYQCVLVAGGYNTSGTPIASAETTHETTGFWTSAGSMAYPLAESAGVLMSNGYQAVVTGGATTSGGAATSAVLRYDFSTGAWANVAALSAARKNHTMTVDTNGGGQIIVAGGLSSYASGALSTYEIWSSNLSSHTATMSLPVAVAYHTASQVTLSGTPRVVLVGGWNDSVGALAQSYYYNGSGWTSTGSGALARYSHAATVMSDGRLLVAGGSNNSALQSDAQIMSTTGVWSSSYTGALAAARYNLSAAPLLNSPGGAVIAGGTTIGTAPPPVYTIRAASALVDRYTPSTNTFAASGSMMTSRSSFGLVGFSYTKQVMAISGLTGVAGSGRTAASEFYLGVNGAACSAADNCVSNFCNSAGGVSAAINSATTAATRASSRVTSARAPRTHRARRVEVTCAAVRTHARRHAARTRTARPATTAAATRIATRTSRRAGRAP